MNKFFAGVNIGKKNIMFGVALFVALGVVVGVPLTVDLFGGALLSGTQYQAWKVLHAYGVFLAFINFFFGFLVDRLSLGQQPKEVASWSFLISGLAGGLGRPALFLGSVLAGWAGYAISLIETLGFVLGTLFFVRSRFAPDPAQELKNEAHASAKTQTADGSQAWSWEGWADMMKALEASGVNLNDCLNFMKGKADEYLDHLRTS
jgi:hypothetical protein